MENNKPIGVFDSGVGGLTAVRELHKLLPNENIVYFGDTGRIPYGTRSRETIIKYTGQALRFLMRQDVKALVAACGTVSTVLDDKMAAEFGVGVPYTGIVLPATRLACALSAGGRVGVIATSAAIRSGAYGRAVRAISPATKVFGNACPILVSLAENGMTAPDNEIARLAVRQYLAPLIREEIDTLILGCTHYPLFYDTINEALEYKVTLIDGGAAAVKELKTLLTGQQLLREDEAPAQTRYFVTDAIETFTDVARNFLQEEPTGSVTKIDLEEIDT